MPLLGVDWGSAPFPQEMFRESPAHSPSLKRRQQPPRRGPGAWGRPGCWPSHTFALASANFLQLV